MTNAMAVTVIAAIPVQNHHCSNSTGSLSTEVDAARFSAGEGAGAALGLGASAGDVVGGAAGSVAEAEGRGSIAAVGVCACADVMSPSRTAAHSMTAIPAVARFGN